MPNVSEGAIGATVLATAIAYVIPSRRTTRMGPIVAIKSWSWKSKLNTQPAERSQENLKLRISTESMKR